MERHDSVTASDRPISQGSSISFMGSLLTFLVESGDSGGRLSVIEYRARPGSEPLAHVHAREDEFFYILEGRLTVFVGEETFSVEAGGCVLLPRAKPHAFRIESAAARVLAVIVPAGLEGFFRALGQPAGTLDLPAQGQVDGQADGAQVADLARKYGV
jgi:mannose-6-phosphate isomerase-like protein (cupin superfamily)